MRLALGAQPASLVLKMLRETTAATATGACAGVIMFIIVGRLFANLLYNTTLADPGVIAAAVSLMGGGALAAAWIQARHIAAVSPTSAMRQE